MTLYNYTTIEIQTAPEGITVKRFLTPVLACLLALSVLAGCGGAQQPAAPNNAAQQPKAESTTPTLDKIKAEGKLVIGTSPDYPPFESLDEKNNVIGFDIDLMNKVAEKLGVKLEIVQTDFGGLIAALNAKKFDIMAAGVTITDERKQQVDFSNPYIAGTDAVVVHKENTKEIKSLQDLKGMTVGVQMGTIQADAVNAVEGVNVKEYDLFTTAAAAVSSKQVDAMFLHTVVAKSFAAADPNLKIVFEAPAKETAYALRKDTPDLTKAVNDVLDELKANGELDKLMTKWFK